MNHDDYLEIVTETLNETFRSLLQAKAQIKTLNKELTQSQSFVLEMTAKSNDVENILRDLKVALEAANYTLTMRESEIVELRKGLDDKQKEIDDLLSLKSVKSRRK